MGFEKRQLILIGIAGIVGLFLVLAFTYGIKPENKDNKVTQDTLTVWGVFDSAQVFEEVFDKYERKVSGLRIAYQQMDPLTYERELINALAAGRGPDIFMVHNTWLAEHFEKMAPAPPTLVPYTAYATAFPEAVLEDFAPGQIVYASPLYLDTLALYYNKDIFDREGVAVPPRTWEELQQLVPRLRKADTVRGTISRAAITMGGAPDGVNRAADIVMLLMMQYGAEMVDRDFTEATFDRKAPASFTARSTPAKDALDFYAQFGNPASQYYTWNDKFAYSIDAFSEGRAVMMLNYSHQMEVIENKNPFLRYGVLPVPQASLEQPMSFPSYWGFAVSAQSHALERAWDFITFVTMDPEQSRLYLEASKRPPALRTLLRETENDVRLGIFSAQALIARSWLRPENEAVEAIFSDMISGVITGRVGTTEAISQGAANVTALIQKSRFMKKGSLLERR